MVKADGGLACEASLFVTPVAGARFQYSEMEPADGRARKGKDVRLGAISSRGG